MITGENTMIYITGDTHGDFRRVHEFCRRFETTEDDILIILSHTTPLKYEPTEVFLSCIDQSKVDKSTEQWLDKIEENVEYKKWYCGHYHTNKKIDKVSILFEDIVVFRV